MSVKRPEPNDLGQLPVRLLVSEAGLGLRKDEIRTLSAEVADRMVELKSAEYVDWAKKPAAPKAAPAA